MELFVDNFAGRQKQSTPGVARGVHRRYALGSLGLHAAMARVGWHRWARRQARRRWRLRGHRASARTACGHPGARALEGESEFLATKARREHPLPRKPGAWETRMRERMARRTA